MSRAELQAARHGVMAALSRHNELARRFGTLYLIGLQTHLKILRCSRDAIRCPQIKQINSSRTWPQLHVHGYASSHSCEDNQQYSAIRLEQARVQAGMQESCLYAQLSCNLKHCRKHLLYQYPQLRSTYDVALPWLILCQDAS